MRTRKRWRSPVPRCEACGGPIVQPHRSTFCSDECESSPSSEMFAAEGVVQTARKIDGVWRQVVKKLGQED